MTSRWTQSAEAWTRMVEKASGRWDAALVQGRDVDNFTCDKWVGTMVGSWVAMMDGMSEMADLWLGTAPGEKEVPTLAIVVDYDSAQVERTLDTSLPPGVDVFCTPLVSASGAEIPADVTTPQGKVRVTISDLKRFAPGQYLGMVYQNAQGGWPPAIANVHFVKLAPRGASSSSGPASSAEGERPAELV